MAVAAPIPVPTVDLAAALAGDAGAVDAAAAAIDEACSTSGFFIIVGHGVDAGLISEVLDNGRRFFKLPYEDKQLVSPPGPEHYRGYLGMDTTSLAATLGDEVPPDLCESFNVNRFDDPDARARAFVEGAEAATHPNLWPEQPPTLRPVLECYYATMQDLCLAMLPIFARALALPDDWFDDKVTEHTALLLLNWYPPMTQPPRPAQLRRGAHTDYGAFTIVAAEQIPGLQIMVDDDWVDVPVVPGGFVVNTGDLMARWTNDRWISTLHRVVVPNGDDQRRDRMSVPYFFQPSYGAVIETIPTTITAERPMTYEPVVAGKWITAKSMSMLEDNV